MARPQRDSEYIFGIHDPGGEDIMLQAGKPGWVLFTEAIGSNPGDGSGKDYRPWSNRGLGVIVRLNNGYEPDGTIPVSERYMDFARRCGNFVKASKGAHLWIIGNEMNFVVERPTLSGRAVQPAMALDELDGDQDGPHSPREHPDRFNVIRQQDEGPAPRSVRGFRSVGAGREVITPQRYATCYRLCREIIKAQPGHADDQVLVGAVAPWNNQTVYEGNPNGDWVQYFQDILLLLEADGCDGFTLHTYTHGADPNLVYSKATMNPPFDHRHYHFFTYRDFMHAVPASMRHLPCYITEADQDVEWRNRNTGWVRNAYGEINWWNQQPGNQQIRALILYRWPANYDKWGIDGKQGVIDDLRLAMQHDYKWRTQPKPVPTPPEPQRPPYRVDWLEGGGLRQVAAGQVLTTRFKVRNAGSETWVSSGVNKVRLGYHWTDGGGQPIVLPSERDFRTALPGDVETGQSVVLENVQVAVPDQPGALKLRWDLVEEGISWFKDRGSPEKVETVTVVAAPPPDEEFFEQTGKRVKGSFLAWYREHGLDVTGYPVTDQFLDSATGLPTQYFQRVVMEEHEPGSIRLRLAGAELKGALERVTQSEQEIARLRARIQDLTERLQELQAGTGPRIPAPAITDIVDQLPRNPEGFAHRASSAIRYLVINHTGGPASLAIAQVAEYHVQRGYPGIAYHYFIDQDGAIWAVNPWTDVISNQGYMGAGLNIAIAGKFDSAIPNDAQLDAAARLCAWLQQQLVLDADAVKGVSEFVAHGSPGSQWLGGRRYKQMLLQRIAAVEPVPGPDQPPAGEVAQLRARIAALQAELDRQQGQVMQLRQLVEDRDRRIAGLEGQADQAVRQIADQQAEIARLRDLLAQGSTPPAVPAPLQKPAVRDVVDQLQKHPTKRYDTRPRSQITHLCIHHSAVAANLPVENIARYHVESRDWPGIGYHFYVKPDGTIYQTNRIETISWQVGGNNHYTVGICVSGNFLNAVPTAPQLDAAARLSGWLMQELDIPDDHVLGHKEYPNNDTTCPGTQWEGGRKWKEMLLAKIRDVRDGGATAKAINHYVLFWQRPDSWAREDWLAAEKYVGRFRPTTGFSVDDARSAEFVTIVGGVAGVSFEAEELLKTAGCQVERLAGVDFADTKRILDELAESGRRFLHLP